MHICTIPINRYTFEEHCLEAMLQYMVLEPPRGRHLWLNVAVPVADATNVASPNSPPLITPSRALLLPEVSLHPRALVATPLLHLGGFLFRHFSASATIPSITEVASNPELLSAIQPPACWARIPLTVFPVGAGPACKGRGPSRYARCSILASLTKPLRFTRDHKLLGFART